MSGTLEAVKRLATAGNVRISEHGYDELVEDHIAARDIMGALADAVVVEDYPEFPKGPAVLVLHTTVQMNRFMSSGVYPEGIPAQRCW